ncbi:hypothetical protein BZM26_36770 [Paraburkholderia strydomiana]|nr:hypothetical protein BZM26_36770 [Paraburkholderia strydomiana]
MTSIGLTALRNSPPSFAKWDAYAVNGLSQMRSFLFVNFRHLAQHAQKKQVPDPQRPVGRSFVIDGASKPLWQHATSRRAVTWKAVQHEYAATSRVQHEADRRASADVTNSPILGFAALAESFLDAEQRIAERRYFYTSRRRHLADVSRSMLRP